MMRRVWQWLKGRLETYEAENNPDYYTSGEWDISHRTCLPPETFRRLHGVGVDLASCRFLGLRVEHQFAASILYLRDMEESTDRYAEALAIFGVRGGIAAIEACKLCAQAKDVDDAMEALGMHVIPKGPIP